MHTPLSNFLFRPRSTQHRFRRSCSSHSSLHLSSSTSSTSSSTVSSSSSAAQSLATNVLTDQTIASDTGVPKSTSHDQMISDPIPAHSPSFESPFPSPYSLNVPLSSSGTYLCTLTLPNHATSLSLSSGLLYMGLPCGDILVFQTPRLPECARFGIGSLPVQALLVSTSSTIFTAHKDHKIRIWDRPDADGGAYNLRQTLPTAADYLRNLVFSKRYIKIRRHHKCLWIQHVDTITALALDSASLLLYSASWDRTFKVWNLRNMRCMQSVKAHDDAINAILVSSQSDGFICTASADATIKVWKKLSAKKIVHAATLAGHAASVNALVMKTDLEILYSGSSDCSIDVWQRVARNKLAWKLSTTLRGHRSPVLCLAVSGPLVCSGGADKMVRVWRRGGLGSYTCLATLQGHGGPVKSVAIAVSSLRSCYVYSASLDSTTKVWSVLFEREEHAENNDTSITKN